MKNYLFLFLYGMMLVNLCKRTELKAASNYAQDG